MQLRHMRASNQIAILTEFRETYADPEFTSALEFVRQIDTKLSDPGVRAQFRQDPLPVAFRPFLRVAYLYENLGCLVKRGVLDTDLVCDLYPKGIPRIAPEDKWLAQDAAAE